MAFAYGSVDPLHLIVAVAQKASLRRCLCEKRNYTQSQTRQAILDHVQAIEPTNVPVDAGEGNENHPPAGDNLLPPPVVFSEALMMKCVIR